MEHTELNKPRIDYIDGIRGAAALSVVLFHFFWESMGSIMPEMKNHITAFFFNGSCAVIIFFILSGDSLSISFFKDRDSRKLIPIFLKRYFRLTFMVFITVMIVYFFMKVGFIYNKEAGITLNSDWLSGFLGFPPGILNAISYSFSNVYTGMGNDYNPFFWTMRFELLGSYFILLYLFCFNSMKKPIAIAIFMYFFLALCGSYMSFFFIGMVFSGMRSNGYIEYIESKLKLAFNTLLIFLLVLLTSYIYIEAYVYGKVMLSIVYFFTCPLTIILIYTNSVFKKIFSQRFFLFLGKISYPLYAIHFVVLITFFSYFVSHYELDNSRLILLGVVSTITSIFFAALLEMIESKYLLFLSHAVNKIMK